MEPEGAKRIWECSMIKNKLRYTELFSDGDSKSYTSIKDIYRSIFKVQKKKNLLAIYRKG